MRTPKRPNKPMPVAIAISTGLQQPVIRVFIRYFATISLVTALIVGAGAHVRAESLFRAGIAYQTSQAYTPNSLFNLPRARTVGDVITINISEVNQVTLQSNSTLTKEQTINENSTGIINNIAHRLGVSNLLPTVDGLDVQDDLSLRAQNQKRYQFVDNIACQVVQVLPNGFLVVQGRKSILQSKERQDLIVSGIVNPFQLSSANAIDSQQVANLSIKMDARGPMERKQGDGWLGKYFSVFN
ncbi:MAG: flagellar basal body L-ring protein FlgH [Cyanobacteria bacterium HKST-UBA05]|nr:flagellar basal body L-ring protein FlgH [Cyanobacteria bacterium HKST-UBA05]